jgi:hypothetical protein
MGSMPICLAAGSTTEQIAQLIADQLPALEVSPGSSRRFDD